jgi:PKHD-type hydroxylase
LRLALLATFFNNLLALSDGRRVSVRVEACPGASRPTNDVPLPEAREPVFLRIKNLLQPPEVARLAALSRELKFVDGRVSNPANLTKNNLQVDLADPKYAESVQIVGAALTRSREFVDYAMPKRVAPPMLCRYEPGMKYGAHADAAILHIGNERLRSDLSCTVFVGDPAGYEGGELLIVAGNQTLAFKDAAGDAIVYPSTTLHEVAPVRSGQRLVSITFIESYIADQHQRNQVYELNEIAALEGNNMRWESRVRLDVVRQNLLRMWSTT